jgi:tyrosyl-tRNA synthetase
MTFELLEGTDGRKMSSSWGNVINLTDEPVDMFGKVMSLRDELIPRYFELATLVPLNEVKAFLKETTNPRDQKLQLGWQIVSQYHGPKKADEAKAAFVAQFSNKELPSDIPVIKVKPGTYTLSAVLVETKLATSKSEARRLIEQGGVRVDQKQVVSDTEIQIQKTNNLLVQVGKRKFIRIV